MIIIRGLEYWVYMCGLDETCLFFPLSVSGLCPSWCKVHRHINTDELRDPPIRPATRGHFPEAVDPYYTDARITRAV